MRYGAQLGSAALYACVSALLVFSNKALPSVFDFNYPIAMLMFQMLLLQVILLGLGVTRMIKPPQLTAKGFLVHLPVSFLYCLNASLALASLQAVSIPTYGVLKRAGPLFIVLISGAAKHVHAAMRARRDAVGDPQELLMDKKRNLQRQLREIELRLTGADTAKLEEGLLQEDGRDAEIGQAGDGLSPKQKGAGEREAADDSGPGVVAGVVIIVVGALLTGYSDLYLTTSTLTIALLSNVTQSLYVLMVEAKNHGKAGVGIKFDYGEGAGLCQCLCIAESFTPPCDQSDAADSTIGLLCYNSILSVPMLGVFTALLYLHSGSGVLGFLNASLYSRALLGNMLLVALLGISLNYSMFLCIRYNSALTASMVGHVKTMASTFLGFFVLAKDVHASPLYISGIMMSVAGGSLFTIAKYVGPCVPSTPLHLTSSHLLL